MFTAPRSPKLGRAAAGIFAAFVCAGLAACGPAASDPASADTAAASGPLDTSRLPRVANAKQLYASPFSTVYTTPASVAEAAGSIAKTLSLSGWQKYVAPFTDYATGPDFQMMSFKKRAQAIEISVSRAPAQGNATSVSYTAIVLTNDLPVPADSTDIAFDPQRPYLSCLTTMPVPETLAYYTKALAPMGYALWPGLAQQAANKKANGAGERADHAYFVRDGHQPLHLVLHRGDDPRTKVEIEAVSAEMLTAELAPDPTPAAAPGTVFHAKKAPDKVDMMIEDAMQQMTNAILAAAGDAVANAGKPQGKPVAAAGKSKAPAMPDVLAEMREMARVKDATDAPTATQEAELVAEDMDGFPIPESHTSTQSGQTKYRSERQTTVPASLKSVLAFYERELPKRGWKQMSKVVETADGAMLRLSSSKGASVLTLSRQDGETAVSFIEKREAEAKKAGILPKAGQAKLIFGSMAETPATVTLGKKTIKLEPGVGGGKTPDGPMLDVAPGKYVYSVAVPGSAPVKDEVEVAEGEAWALVIGPGGGSMPLHMY